MSGWLTHDSAKETSKLHLRRPLLERHSLGPPCHLLLLGRVLLKTDLQQTQTFLQKQVSQNQVL